MVVLEVPHDRVATRVQSLDYETSADPDDQLDRGGIGRTRRATRTPRSWLERLVALRSVAGHELVDPRTRDPIGLGNFGGPAALHNNSSDNQPGF